MAEQSEGFVWRLKDEESNNATKLNPYNDEQIVVNISVWENIETLENFVYKTFHTDFLKRRKEWFHRFGKTYAAMWWIPAGNFPTAQEAAEKLAYLQQNGASEMVFDYKDKFPSPNKKVKMATCHLSSNIFKISTLLSPFHPFTFSPFHLFTLSLFHPFTLSPFHPFTLSPFFQIISFSVKYRSASKAAIQPVPAAVTA